MRNLNASGAVAIGIRIVVLLVLMTSAAAAGTVYEWIDERGVIYLPRSGARPGRPVAVPLPSGPASR
ncbi:MAG: DUF4124 domain-containing protein [Pseudomonadota bacterium]